MNSYTLQPDGVFPSVCSLDCPDQCGLLVHKKEGRIVKIEGDPSHPVTQGAICNKVRHMAHRIYDEKRLQYPLKRVGRKGEGRFERITWDEAIDTIVARWNKIIAEQGAEAILPYSFYGNMGRLGTEGMDRRFFHRLGASRLQYTICQAAGTEGYNYTMGGGFGIDPEDTVHAELIIMWGINAVSTNMHQVVLAEKARKRGAKIVVIDVHKNQTGRWADWFIPVRPGTDAALALGLMHILFAEGLTDEAFLERYTVGHAELREHVRSYDPDSVAEITGVPVEDLYRLARMYGGTKASFLRIGNGPQHHDNGGMCIRTIACLPALTGAWLYPGGGAIKGNGSYLEHNAQALQRPDLLPKQTRRINMNLLGSALLELDPPVASLFVYNSNPAVVAPHANKVREGLAREDLFTVVHELFLTETAAYADLVLPATSAFENTDFYRSYWHHYVQIQEPVIEAYGESKSNVEVFRLLAAAMGFEDEALRDTEADMIRQALDYPRNEVLEGMTYEKLAEQQFLKGKVKPLFPGRLHTPSGKIELYSKTMERRGFPPLPTYIPLPVEDEGDLPFLFIPAPNHNFLNSTFAHNDKHVRMEREPKLHINEADAAALGIANGDRVRVWNARGECELTAAVGTDVLPGVAVSQGLWADGKDGKALVNALTPDRVADMGGGAVFFSGRVRIEKCAG
ncbi:molybdopterin-containing oxidoreductase family protein [Paenibacillus mucilaginosus]|uniref:YoaE n=1 Tax=Paenibacillus mucilaginosus (strain KNP414) TaxID=1036673 RepID=F8F4N9_PAEMK|nr:molybdopterin oxidoreductase family protein [Paenibacillus mucilaginosus]AEI39431.1 YoaE [Paenibacillus mucilaginosus KNP414]MCG7214733.1 molybdopterin oxidoreductase family protein [Paenibacillus mucilaginosus]WDM28406.1 molybdopterin oxidoreductase family protein [Paenibacillus mucilaginosus]